jgi:hypothetical protein
MFLKHWLRFKEAECAESVIAFKRYASTIAIAVPRHFAVAVRIVTTDTAIVIRAIHHITEIHRATTRSW